MRATENVKGKADVATRAGVALDRSSFARAANEEKIRAWAEDIIAAVAPPHCGSEWTCAVDTDNSSCQTAGCGNTVNISDHQDPATGDIHPKGGMQCGKRGHRVCWNCVMGDDVMKSFEFHEDEWAFVRHEVYRIKYIEPEPSVWFGGDFSANKSGSPKEMIQRWRAGSV